jgi:glutaredoxin
MSAIRWFLGELILLINLLTLPKPILREKSDQNKIDKVTKHLTIYQFNACPFCVKVRRFFKKKSLKIELIDAKKEHHKHDLIQNGGRQKVPCLRVQLENKTIRWIYESNDIIDFLSREIESK